MGNGRWFGSDTVNSCCCALYPGALLPFEIPPPSSLPWRATAATAVSQVGAQAFLRLASSALNDRRPAAVQSGARVGPQWICGSG